MNTERILELAQKIEELPAEQFGMEKFWRHVPEGWWDGKNANTLCRSPGCIAGHTVALYGDGPTLMKRTLFKNFDIDMGETTDEYAKDLLDLSESQAEELFEPCGPSYNAIDTAWAASTLRHSGQDRRGRVGEEIALISQPVTSTQ